MSTTNVWLVSLVVFAVVLCMVWLLLLRVLDKMAPKSQPVVEPPYVVEPIAEGWYCRSPACGVFNGDAKEFLTNCRTCGSERPRGSSVRFPSQRS